MWVLALAFHFQLSLMGAFATMGLIGIGIMLPNSPGLVGQFEYFGKLGLSFYLPAGIAAGAGMAYLGLLHGLQLVWYVGVGCLSLLSSHTSFTRVIRASRAASANA